MPKPIRWAVAVMIDGGYGYCLVVIDRKKRETNSFSTYEEAERAAKTILKAVKSQLAINYFVFRKTKR